MGTSLSVLFGVTDRKFVQSPSGFFGDESFPFLDVSHGLFWVRRADKRTTVDTLWVMCKHTFCFDDGMTPVVSVSALHQLQVHLWESELRSTGSVSQQLPASSHPRRRRHLGGFAHRLSHAQPHVHDGAPVRRRDTATQVICRMLPTWWCDTEQTLSFCFHRVSVIFLPGEPSLPVTGKFAMKWLMLTKTWSKLSVSFGSSFASVWKHCRLQ